MDYIWLKVPEIKVNDFGHTIHATKWFVVRGFSLMVTGGRPSFFFDLSAGEAPAPTQSENGEGASVPCG